MVPQCDLMDALFPNDLIQGPPAHLCTHRAGVLFMAVIKNDRADLRLNDGIGHLQLVAECLYR